MASREPASPEEKAEETAEEAAEPESDAAPTEAQVPTPPLADANPEPEPEPDPEPAMSWFGNPVTEIPAVPRPTWIP